MGIRDGRIVRLKVCPDCGKEKTCEDSPDSGFAIHSRRKDGTVYCWSPLCKPCWRDAQKRYRDGRREATNARRRERHAERMAFEPGFREAKRKSNYAAMQRWLAKPENVEKARKAWAAYGERRRQERREEVNELARMDYALRQERKGLPVHTSPAAVSRWPRVAVGEFREWIRAYRRLRDLPSNNAVARELEMHERTMSRLMEPDHQYVAYDLVDRSLINARAIVILHGRDIVTAADLYPDA